MSRNVWLLFMLLMVLIISCERNNVGNVPFEPLDDGRTGYNLLLPNNDIITIEVDTAGSLMLISNHTRYEEQFIWYWPNGNIKALYRENKKHQVHGRALYFYESSGNLDSSFPFINGEKHGYAFSFYDSSFEMKEIMYYREDGKLIERLTYSEDGELLKKEGSEPKEK